MDSLSITFSGSISGTAKGIPSNALVTSPLVETLLSASLNSTDTGANQASESYGPQTRTLTASSSEELDLTSFTNSIGETGRSISECRLFYIVHSPVSEASSISFGNASGTPFRPYGMDLTTALSIKPGEGIVFFAPTSAAMAVAAGARLIKILNDDGANTATYRIFWSGS